MRLLVARVVLGLISGSVITSSFTAALRDRVAFAGAGASATGLFLRSASGTGGSVTFFARVLFAGAATATGSSSSSFTGAFLGRPLFAFGSSGSSSFTVSSSTADSAGAAAFLPLVLRVEGAVLDSSSDETVPAGFFRAAVLRTAGLEGPALSSALDSPPLVRRVVRFAAATVTVVGGGFCARFGLDATGAASSSSVITDFDAGLRVADGGLIEEVVVSEGFDCKKRYMLAHFR